MPLEQDTSAEEEVIPCEHCESDEHLSADHCCDICDQNGHSETAHPYCESCDTYADHSTRDHRCSNCGMLERECGYCDECDSTRCMCERCYSCEECRSSCICDEDEDGDPEDGVNVHDYSWSPETISYMGMAGDYGQPINTYANGGMGAHSYPEPPDRQAYLGLEVEVECVHGDVLDVACAWNDSGMGWTKTDGSLTQQGIECVTYPVTYARLEHDGALARTLVAMKEGGARAWAPGHCGLHIHISRPSFKDKAHQWRFAAAHEQMSKELRQMSGRNGDEGYCKWEGVMLSERNLNRPMDPATGMYIGDRYRYVPQKATKIIAGKQDVGDRYVSVNVTRGTIELRFWRGSLAPDHVMGAAALADAMQQWTRNMTFAQVRQGLTWKAFQAWATDGLAQAQLLRIVKLSVKRGVQVAPSAMRAAYAAEEVKA